MMQVLQSAGRPLMEILGRLVRNRSANVYLVPVGDAAVRCEGVI